MNVYPPHVTLGSDNLWYLSGFLKLGAEEEVLSLDAHNLMPRVGLLMTGLELTLFYSLKATCIETHC